jgi:hypothetical protein
VHNACGHRNLNTALTWDGSRAVSFIAAVRATSFTAGGSFGLRMSASRRATTSPSVTLNEGSPSRRRHPRPAPQHHMQHAGQQHSRCQLTYITACSCDLQHDMLLPAVLRRGHQPAQSAAAHPQQHNHSKGLPRDCSIITAIKISSNSQLLLLLQQATLW